jgi:HEAT repeat protein
MKYILAVLLVVAIGGVLYIAQTSSRLPKDPVNLPNSQAELEEAIKKIFLRRGTEGEREDTKERLEQLGTKEEVTAILRKLVAEHQYAQEESLDLSYLNGATWMLGEMADKQAEDRLSQMVFDPLVHENIRALAVKSLGNIDALSNKEILLQALRSDESEYLMIRVNAAEGLAKIKDPEVLAALEQAAQQESDSYIREKFQAAAKEIRSKP